MADTFGTQGNMEGINRASKTMASSADKYKKGSEIFRTSVGEWYFGVQMLKEAMSGKNIRGWLEGTASLSSALRDVMEMFTKAKVADLITDLGDTIYSTRKELQRTFGMFGSQNEKMVKGLTDVAKRSAKFGVTIESALSTYTSLATKIGTTKVGTDWVEQTAIMAKSFQMSEDAASDIAKVFSFKNSSPEMMMKFMEKVKYMSTEAGLSPQSVAQSVAESSDEMKRFAVHTEKGYSKFAKMAVTAAKMNTSIGAMVKSMEKFRSIQDAAEASVDFSLIGMNVNALQLMADARRNNPDRMFSESLKHLNKFTDSQGTILPGAYEIADAIGEKLDMTRDELQTALDRQRQKGDKAALEHYRNVKKQAQEQRAVQERLGTAMWSILATLTPVFEKLAKFLDSKAALPTLGLLAGGIGLMNLIPKIGVAKMMWKKTKLQDLSWGNYIDRNKKSGPGRRDPISFPQRFRRMFEMTKMHGFDRIDDDESGELRQTPRRGSRGRNARGLPGDLIDPITGQRSSPIRRRGPTINYAGQAQAFAAQAKQMFASGVRILSFAGAIFVLALAFKEFSKVEWKGVGTGVASMTAFTALMLGFSRWGGDKFTYRAAGAFIALGVAMYPLAQSLILMNSVDLIKLSLGLGALAVGVGAITALGAVMGAGGWVAGLIGVASIVTTIGAIGATAKIVSAPIESLSLSMERLANAMVTISTLGPKPIDLSIDRTKIKMLSDVSGKVIAGSSAGQIVLHVTSNLNLDSKKIATGIETYHFSTAEGRAY